MQGQFKNTLEKRCSLFSDVAWSILLRVSYKLAIMDPFNVAPEAFDYRPDRYSSPNEFNLIQLKTLHKIKDGTGQAHLHRAVGSVLAINAMGKTLH